MCRMICVYSTLVISTIKKKEKDSLYFVCRYTEPENGCLLSGTETKVDVVGWNFHCLTFP